MISLEWDLFTLFFYIIIIFSTYTLSFFVYNTRNFIHATRSSLYINKLPLFIIFFCFFIISALRETGTDYPVYIDIFNSSNNKLEALDFGIEPGFLAINLFVRLFTSSSQIFISIISFITTYLVFISLLRFRENINFPLSILIYSTFYYFQSFSLVRIYLASAIILYSFQYLFTKSYLKYFLFLLFSFSIHYSTILLSIPIFGLFLYRNKPFLFYLFIFILLLVTYKFSNYLIYFNLTNRYSDYLESIDKSGTFGYFQLFIHAPILIFLKIVRKKNILNSWFLDIITVFTWCSFFFGVIGYWIPTISRVNYLITYPFILFLPIAINSFIKSKYFYLFYISCIAYIAIIIFVYFNGLAYSDGITDYTTIFNQK
jgi:transmembrane protein EpsG